MASKEYEMMFKLSAQLGKEFGTTFSSAQKAMIETQREIKALNQQQADIAAYQKQQQAVETTSRKLSDLQKEYDNIQREINETESFSSSLENKLIEKQRQIDKTSDSLQKQTTKLDEMGNALNEAGVDTNKLKEESDKLTTELNELGEKMEDFGETGTGSFEAVGSALVAAGIAKGLSEIKDAYIDCINLAADFESTMSTVEALSGANANELTELSALAKELGATTKFTAVESAEAMTYMAMAGWDANQMLAGMDGVLQLAAASGEDLALTSDIVTDNLTAFGLTAADTAHFSDVLAAAATSSNTSVSIMGETFKNCAAQAGALDYSIDDVAVAVGLMANAGIKGSNAGTALKNVFNGLLEGITLTSNAFGEVEYSAINADGTMKSFSETLNDLRGYFSQMTGAEQLQNAETIAGQRAMAGFVSILNASESDFDSLTASIQNCSGSAAKMAAIKLDNYAGQVTLLNSATDALKTTIGEAFQEELTSIVKTSTKIISSIQEFLGKHPGITKAIIAITAEAGAFLLVYKAYQAYKKIDSTLTTVLTALKKKETEETLKANAAILANPYVLVAAGVIALTAGIIALVEAQKSEENQARKLSTASREQYDELQNLKGEYEETVALYGENSEEAAMLAFQIDELSQSYEANKQTIEEYKNETKELVDTLTEKSSKYKETVDELNNNAVSASALISRLEELATATKRTSVEDTELSAIMNRLSKDYPNLANSISAAVNQEQDWGAVKTALEKEGAARALTAAQDAYADAVGDVTVAEVKKAQAENEAAAAREAQMKASLAYEQKFGQSTEGLGAIFAYFSSEAKDMRAASDNVEAAEERVNELDAALNTAKETYGQTGEEMQAYLDTLYGTDEATKNLNLSINETMTEVDELSQKYLESYNAAFESVHGQYALWDEAADVVAVSASTINSNLADQANYWSDYNANLQALQERTGEIAGLNEVIASFADGSAESVNAIAGMASASDSDLKRMVENWNAVQDEQKAVSESIAELTTNFTNEMDKLQTQLEADVKAMNLSEEAKQSGQNTIEGFIVGAESKLPAVKAAYSKIAQAAKEAIDQTLDMGSPSRVMIEEAKMTWQGYINGTKEMTPEVQKAMSNTANTASEAVNNQAIEAAPIFTGSTYSPSVTINIGGNADENTVTMLNQYADDFAERVMSVIDNAEIDSSRRKYR